MKRHDEALRQEVLEACHGLAAYGLGSVIGGHVSARVPNEPLFYTHAFDKTFEEMEIEDILLLDFDGKVIGSDRLPSIGIDFHHGIYKQRSDINSVVHTHGFWITAQAAFARAPRIFNNVSTPFYGRTTLSRNDDFSAIGPALGNDDIAIVIPWHGAITVGKDLGEAVARHVLFDYTAKMDVTLPDCTPTIPDHQCSILRDLVNRSGYFDETWQLVRRKAKVFSQSRRIAADA